MKTSILFGDKRKFISIAWLSTFLFLISNVHTARADVIASSLAESVAISAIVAWSIIAIGATIGLSSLWNRLSRARRPSKR